VEIGPVVEAFLVEPIVDPVPAESDEESHVAEEREPAESPV
jgi:hypothetical protein